MSKAIEPMGMRRQQWGRDLDSVFVIHQLQAIFDKCELEIHIRKRREAGCAVKQHILPFAYRWSGSFQLGDYAYEFAVPEKTLHPHHATELGQGTIRRFLTRNSWFTRKVVSVENDLERLKGVKHPTPAVFESSSRFLRDVLDKAEAHARALEEAAAMRAQQEALVEDGAPTDHSSFGLIGVCAGKMTRVPVVLGMDRLVCVNNAAFFEAFTSELTPMGLNDDEFLDTSDDDDDDDVLNIPKGIEQAFKDWLTLDHDEPENIKFVGVLSDKYGDLVTLTFAVAGRELTVITSLSELQKIPAFEPLKELNDYLPKKPKMAKAKPGKTAPVRSAQDDDDEDDDTDEEGFR